MIDTGLLICGEVHRWDDTVEQARTAEALGYDSVWLAEHHFLEESYSPAPLVGLTALAALTERVLLGPSVMLAPFYHPVRLAEETALLQNMSGGRFICGLGLGYREEEFAAFGVSRRRRRAHLEETIELLRRLWSGDPVTFRGEVYSIDDVAIVPRPDTPPPIWIGGWAPPAIERAVRTADAWFPGPTADLYKLRECYAVYEEALTTHDADHPTRPIIREIWVADTEAGISEGRQRLLHMYEEEYRSFGQENVGEGDVLADRAFVGSPQQVADSIGPWVEEFGIDHVIGRMHLHGTDQRAVLRSMELFAEQVRPSLETVAGRS